MAAASRLPYLKYIVRLSLSLLCCSLKNASSEDTTGRQKENLRAMDGKIKERLDVMQESFNCIDCREKPLLNLIIELRLLGNQVPRIETELMNNQEN